MSVKVYCPVCHEKMIADAGHIRSEADVKLLLYKEPNGTPSTCCSTCYDKIEMAHYRLVKNILWDAVQNRKFLKLKAEKNLTAPTE